MNYYFCISTSSFIFFLSLSISPSLHLLAMKYTYSEKVKRKISILLNRYPKWPIEAALMTICSRLKLPKFRINNKIHTDRNYHFLGDNKNILVGDKRFIYKLLPLILKSTLSVNEILKQREVEATKAKKSEHLQYVIHLYCFINVIPASKHQPAEHPAGETLA